jgi:hypothetical protein
MQDEFKKERSAGTIELGKAMTQDSISIAEEMTGTGTPEAFYANQRTKFRSIPRETMSYAMSHHYSILGLDRYTLKSYYQQTLYMFVSNV